MNQFVNYKIVFVFWQLIKNASMIILNYSFHKWTNGEGLKMHIKNMEKNLLETYNSKGKC